MKKIIILLSCFFITLGACTTKKQIQAENPGLDLREKFISLYRSACYGRCPAYKMTINGDGTFIYFGKSYVKRLGGYKGKLSQEETNKIFKLLETFKWKNYPDEYPIDNVDFPQFILEYNTKKKYKKIFGNSNAAKEILEFNKSIDLLINNVAMEKLD